MIPTPTQVYEALRYRIETGKNGSRQYYNTDGQLHRMGGPLLGGRAVDAGTSMTNYIALTAQPLNMMMVPSGGARMACGIAQMALQSNTQTAQNVGFRMGNDIAQMAPLLNMPMAARRGLSTTRNCPKMSSIKK